jgi:hypothetical protein
MTTRHLPHLPLLVLLAAALLVEACGVGGSRRNRGGDDDDEQDDDDSAPADDDDSSGNDDDDATVPPDDDDATAPMTLEGYWVGSLQGTIVYGATTYDCVDAGGSMTVGAGNVANGTAACLLEGPSLTCSAALSNVTVNGSAVDTVLGCIPDVLLLAELNSPSLSFIDGFVSGSGYDSTDTLVTISLTMDWERASP